VEEIEHILRDFGLILGAGLVSQLIATAIRLPQMVVLVAAGALIGPSVLGLVSALALRPSLVSMSARVRRSRQPSVSSSYR
jgi:Kef-type K+ transport system membrane component KefB